MPKLTIKLGSKAPKIKLGAKLKRTLEKERKAKEKRRKKRGIPRNTRGNMFAKRKLKKA
jgi:hypothetical protein